MREKGKGEGKQEKGNRRRENGDGKPEKGNGKKFGAIGCGDF